MNNVVALNASAAMTPTLSPIMFKAYERPLFYTGSNQDHQYHNTGHKALCRVLDDKPVCLNVVRDTYKVVQNMELFDAVERGLRSGVSETELRTARIRDKVSYNGAQCFREYIFPDIAVPSPERDTIAFRVIVQNGFGTGAIKLYSGAIDFFCTNGLVLGEYTSLYAKHTKGVSINDFERVVRGSVELFWKNKQFYADLAGKKVLGDDEVKAFLDHNFGERLGARLMYQFRLEINSRGRTLWALYSALTHYSSHADGEFALRNTSNDHAAATMMKREKDVLKVTDDNAFLKLAA